MEALQWIEQPSDHAPPGRVAGFLGSFDPPHKGHEWIADHLLGQHDRVILLLPARHLHKQIVPPFNATLQQRCQMLRHVRATCPERIGIAIAPEVLYLQLADSLQREYPSALIGFGMGDESRVRLEASESWFSRAGVPWTAQHGLRLRQLLARVVVFGRSSISNAHVELPTPIRTISSTRVRATAASLRSTGASWERWRSELGSLVSEPVARFVFDAGLYPEVTSAVRS